MYGLTEMSVWQAMTRLETEEMVELMPILITGNNLLSDTDIHCPDTGGDIEIRSENRKCWILDQQRRRQSDLDLLHQPFSKELEISATLRTGDIGIWSGDGKMLCWRGREDDIVKILGRKVSLEEVGNGLSRELSTPVVCVLEAKTNLIRAFIKSETDLTEASVLAAARRSLSPHQLPGRVQFLPEFPLTEHGKTDLRHLRDLAAQAEPSWGLASQFSEREMGEKCGELWESLVGSHPAGQDNFLSAGGDSFSALALVNSLGWGCQDRKENIFLTNFIFSVPTSGPPALCWISC